MTIYIVNVVLIFVIYGIVYALPIKKKEFIYCLIIGIQLTLISSLRYGIGIDYYSYKLQYEYVNYSENLTGALSYIYFEPGYNLLNYIAANTPWKFQFVITITSVITNCCVAIQIYKFSDNKLISFFLYAALGFFTSSFCWIRQYMAIAIALMAIPYILNQKFIKTMIIVVIAAMFHRIALILIPFYFVANKKLNYKLISLILIGSLAIWFCIDYVFELATNLFPAYSSYLSTTFIHGKNVNSIIPFLFILIVMMVYLKQITKYKKENLIYINSALYAFIFSLFQLKIGIMDRIPQVLYIYTILGIPAILKSYNYNKKNSIIFTLLILFVGIVWFVYTLITDYSGAVPYQSILT